MLVPTYQSTLYHIPEDSDIYQHNCDKTQMLHTCKYPYTHAYTHSETQLPSFKPCPSTTVLSPDITHHLFREAVNIPVIVSLPGP